MSLRAKQELEEFQKSLRQAPREGKDHFKIIAAQGTLTMLYRIEEQLARIADKLSDIEEHGIIATVPK